MKVFGDKIYDFRKKLNFIRYFKRYDFSFIDKIPLRSIILNSLILFDFTPINTLSLFKFTSVILSKEDIIVN